jgi:hypothetical protein
MKSLGVKWEPFRQRLLQNDVANLEKCRIYFTLAANFKEFFNDGKRLVNNLPGDYKYRAYKAAFLALEAKYTPWPHEKLAYVQRALSTLDALVSTRPDDVEIRFLRAIIAERLPIFFNRKAQAYADFEFVVRNLDRLGEREFEVFVLEYLTSEVQLSHALELIVQEKKGLLSA